MKTTNGGRCFSNRQFQAMTLYHRIGRKFGKANLKRARRALYRKIALRFGVDHTYVWSPGQGRILKDVVPKPTPPSVKGKAESELKVEDIEALIDVEEDEICEDDDDAVTTIEDRDLLKKDSYLERFLAILLCLCLHQYMSRWSGRNNNILFP